MIQNQSQYVKTKLRVWDRSWEFVDCINNNNNRIRAAPFFFAPNELRRLNDAWFFCGLRGIQM